MSRPAVGAVVRREVAPEDVPAAVRAIEAAGLDEAWLVEDCFYTAGIACAATALAVTERVRVGLGILPVPLRNPALVAMELATLERMHPGRLVPGLGHGLEEWMLQVGARPRDRLVALEEALEALRALLSGERVDRAGRHVRLDGVQLEFPPARVPPLLAGVTGPRGVAVAGRAADGLVLPELSSPEFVRATRERLGREDAQVVVYALLCVEDDAAAARDAVRPLVRGWLGAADRSHQIAPLGRGEAELAALPDELVARLAVAGDPQGCADAIRALGEAGATSVALMAPPGRDAQQHERVGAEVLRLL